MSWVIGLTHLNIGIVVVQWSHSITANGKVLCAVGDFENGTFSLPHKPDSSTNVQLTTTAPYCTKHVLVADADF